MPKARRTRKVTGREIPTQTRALNTGQGATIPQNGRGSPAPAVSAAGINRPLQAPVASGPQSLIFPAMIALGCWGIAFTFLFLSNDPNHTIFGVLAVLMALLWSFSFALRVRKFIQQRSRG